MEEIIGILLIIPYIVPLIFTYYYFSINMLLFTILNFFIEFVGAYIELFLRQRANRNIMFIALIRCATSYLSIKLITTSSLDFFSNVSILILMYGTWILYRL